MARYAVGDEVMVRPDLEFGKKYYMNDGMGRDAATSSMVGMSGQTVTITSINYDKYRVSGSDCFWTDDMFVPVSASELEESDIPISVFLGLETKKI